MTRTAITGTKANIVASLLSRSLPDSTYPRRLTTLTYGSVDFSGAPATLSLKKGEAHINLSLQGAPAPSAGPDMFKPLWNQPIAGATENGEPFWAEHAVVPSHRYNSANHAHCLEADILSTRWMLGEPSSVLLWAGSLNCDLPQAPGNLPVTIDSDRGSSCSAGHFLLNGDSYSYMLLSSKREVGANAIVIDTHGQSLDHKRVFREMHALGFCVGRPLDCRLLLGLDEHGSVVGYAGTDFGFSDLAANVTACPVPETTSPPWFPSLFRRLTQALSRKSPTSSYLTEAIWTYVESLAERSATSFEAKSLRAALSAARIHLDTDVALVTSSGAWEDWLQQNKEAIASLAPADRQGVLFDGITASSRPGPLEVVRLALATTALPESEVLLSAVREASRTAEGEVLQGSNYSERAAKLRTLTVGLIAKAVGYNGPICGWKKVGGYYFYGQDREWWPTGTEPVEVGKEVKATEAAYVDKKELWPVFAPPHVPTEGILGELVDFASTLRQRTSGHVAARLVATGFASTDDDPAFDFVLEAIGNPGASAVLFSVIQGIDGAVTVLGWASEDSTLADSESVVAFLKDVATSPATKATVERLMIAATHASIVS